MNSIKGILKETLEYNTSQENDYNMYKIAKEKPYMISRCHNIVSYAHPS